QHSGFEERPLQSRQGSARSRQHQARQEALTGFRCKRKRPATRGAFSFCDGLSRGAAEARRKPNLLRVSATPREKGYRELECACDFATHVLNVSAGTLPEIETELSVRVTVNLRRIETISGFWSCTARRIAESAPRSVSSTRPSVSESLESPNALSLSESPVSVAQMATVDTFFSAVPMACDCAPPPIFGAPVMRCARGTSTSTKAVACASMRAMSRPSPVVVASCVPPV